MRAHRVRDRLGRLATGPPQDGDVRIVHRQRRDAAPTLTRTTITGTTAGERADGDPPPAGPDGADPDAHPA